MKDHKEVKAKGVEEKHIEEVEFAKFKVFCDETSEEMTEPIAEGKAKIVQLEEDIDKAESDVVLTGEIADLEGDIAQIDGGDQERHGGAQRGEGGVRGHPPGLLGAHRRDRTGDHGIRNQGLGSSVTGGVRQDGA